MILEKKTKTDRIRIAIGISSDNKRLVFDIV